jgi:lysophospholipase L1-like esterase
VSPERSARGAGLLVALVLLTLVVVPPASAVPAASIEPVSAGEPLLVVGDSLCVGARDHGGGFTGALRRVGWEPEFLCASGEGLPWGIAQVRERVSVPATVVVALGTNPGRREPDFPQRIATLRSDLVARGAVAIIWVDFADRSGGYVDKNETLRAFASRRGDGVVRWSAAVASHPAWFRSDGLHYRDAGMRQWSRRIADETTRLRAVGDPAVDLASSLIVAGAGAGQLHR